ncbi:hypothetical protein GUITHDRAFT_106236 [Guillardia theta CCMP2712]|uniref:RWP-RK domain-containing protein n=1 Tax=Guillardia theta (strain CCMP2712) TaxID=905079 RepID=L1JJ93_GUITC|nr:hypothetical protein GUITHDRAFT_106236 [Guillardia theta CCMP2712]EKX48160.1 hypothetical protein GUITHDRAFT_106236 [Guillardia theta CCMP2712]|eukprot:XP_005835140.1 hypothetical protein GUITHDRAFT_106236 [Guillardia theta CCMP2712]
MHAYQTILTSRRKKTALLTADFIQSLFVMRQQDAADMLGFSITTMKHVCRRLGIRKWPYSRTRTSPSQLLEDRESASVDSLAESPTLSSAEEQICSPVQSIDISSHLQPWDEALKESMMMEGHEKWSAEMGELFRDALEHVDMV